MDHAHRIIFESFMEGTIQQFPDTFVVFIILYLVTNLND